MIASTCGEINAGKYDVPWHAEHFGSLWGYVIEDPTNLVVLERD